MEDKNALYLIDTHAHLNSSRFGGNVAELLEKAHESNVGRMGTIYVRRLFFIYRRIIKNLIVY